MNRYVKFAIILVVVCASLTLIGWGIYWRITHLCVEWESIPTGKKCVEWETYHYPCTHSTGKGHMTTSVCSATRCVRHVPCKECVRIEHVDNAPTELEKPVDRCGW